MGYIRIFFHLVFPLHLSTRNTPSLSLRSSDTSGLESSSPLLFVRPHGNCVSVMVCLDLHGRGRNLRNTQICKIQWWNHISARHLFLTQTRKCSGRKIFLLHNDGGIRILLMKAHVESCSKRGNKTITEKKDL